MKKVLKKFKKVVDIWEIVLYTSKCAKAVGLKKQHKPERNIGVWLSLARVPGLGPGGRRFESCHPDLQLTVRIA